MGILIKPRDVEVPKDDPFKYDLLGRKKPAEVLTRLVANLDEGPCVLAVDAAWGAGKTTFLRMWTQHLRNKEFPVVEINAWETDFSSEPFFTLSTELIDGIRSGETTQLKEASEKVLCWVVPIAMRIAASSVPGASQKLGEKAASYVEERLSGLREARKSVAKFKRVLQDTAAKLFEANGNRPLIVAIDELDRCRPSYAVELLEVAKHLFFVDHIVFVLAVNLDQLAHSVKALYGSDFDAKGYLRRFVDVDFYLPEPDHDAFICEQIRATEIADYFDKTPLGGKLRTMLQKFFGASDLSLRTVGQAICRLGLLYALLRSDQHDYELATTVALILRTIDSDLYHRFCRSDATDLDVVKAIFGHPGMKNLQHEEWGAEFESTIVLAALEDKIPNMSLPEIDGSTLFSPGPIRTRLLGYYITRQQTDRELRVRGGDPEIQERILEGKHAERVFDKVKQAIRSGQGKIGFREAVQQLELLTGIDHQIDR